MEHYFTNNQNLKSELRTLHYENYENVFTFFSDLGVFSKNKIDFGSQVLVDTLLKKVEKIPNTILDVGCGYGFIGIVLSKIWHSKITMVDVNERALHLCQKNMKENQILGECFFSNAYQNVHDTFDLIVTNPPIRAGKDVVLQILQGAREHLNPQGELWFVIRKDQGAKSILKSLADSFLVTVVQKEKGFYVMRAKMD